MNDNVIILPDGKRFKLDVPGKGLNVLEGFINVYIAPYESGEKGRSIFLTTVEPEDIVPSISTYAPIRAGSNENAHWVMYAVPEGDAKALPVECHADDEAKFCHKAGINILPDMDFSEAVLEHYGLEMIRDMRNMYVTAKGNSTAKSRPLHTIYNIFRGKRFTGYADERTESNLFNAVAVVCSYMNIAYVPLSVLISASGRSFDIFDMARVSGFSCRKIQLSAGWDKLDTYPVIGFYGKDNVPVACIPDRKGFSIYFSDTGELRRLDAVTAAEIKASAYMLYRSFPAEKMNMKKVVAFALKDMHISDMAAIFVLGFICIIIGLLIPFINEQVYDLFIPLGSSYALTTVGTFVIACTVGNVAVTLVQSFCNFRVTYRMKYSVQAATVDRLFNLPQSLISRYESADLAKRALCVPEIFGIAVKSILQYGTAFIFSLLYLFRMFDFNKEMTWFAILVLVILCAVIWLIGYRQMKHESSRDEWTRKNNSLLYQLFNNIEKLRMAGAEERGLEQYMNGFIEECKINLSAEKHNYAVTIISTAASTIFSMIFYCMAVKNGESVSIGEFVAFTTAFGGLSGAVMGCAQQWLIINNTIPYYNSAKPILEEVPEKKNNIVVPADLVGGIDVNDVTFSYSAEREPVIKDLSFSVKPGEHIGIVGNSGCGKSTLIKLLLGFEIPQKGKIYYDNQDIESLDKRELRKKLGVVLQSGRLISGSIYDNVVISKPHSTREDIDEAIRMAGLEQDIREMPMGLHTMLSPELSGISGGQKQRILIARAIIGKPRIIYFDEATSALDNKTQAEVCSSLDSLKATRIVIAHRISTVQNCDRIFVMDEGRIVEEGNYESLMKRGGLFFELARMQVN